jgi:antitoxin ParD1/3/4
MATAFPPEIEQFVREEVASGKYRSEEEVVCAGLRLLREREARLQALRNDVLPALEQLDRGEGQPLDAESIKARGRKRREALGGTG